MELTVAGSVGLVVLVGVLLVLRSRRKAGGGGRRERPGDSR